MVTVGLDGQAKGERGTHGLVAIFHGLYQHQLAPVPRAQALSPQPPVPPANFHDHPLPALRNQRRDEAIIQQRPQVPRRRAVHR